jgi:hypothetical protein
MESEKIGLRLSELVSESQNIEGYHFTGQEIAAFKYAPVTSFDVERSFSKYRAFLR